MVPCAELFNLVHISHSGYAYSNGCKDCDPMPLIALILFINLYQLNKTHAMRLIIPQLQQFIIARGWTPVKKMIWFFWDTYNACLPDNIIY